MFSKELRRHIGEIRRAVLGHNYEQHENGILLPRAHVIAAGQYAFRTNKGEWSPWQDNLLPTQGLIWMLNLLGNHASFVQPYIALGATVVTPLAAHNAAGFAATYGEITSGSEGYTESTRVAWVTATASGTAVMHNNASPAEFTMITAGTLAVNNVGMLTASAKGATTLNLISASLFAATRNFSNGDLFDVKYQLGLTSS